MKTKNLIIFHNIWEVANNLEVEEGKMKFKKCVQLSELDARGKRKTNMQIQESKQYGDWIGTNSSNTSRNLTSIYCNSLQYDLCSDWPLLSCKMVNFTATFHNTSFKTKNSFFFFSCIYAFYIFYQPIIS